MSISVPPPEFQFNGLFFNPSFWISTTSSLTQDVANQLYLRKTVTDSASALETFNGGIRADSINVINATGLKTMFATQTGAVTLFPNLIAGSTLRIGSSVNDQSNHVGNIDILKNTINCASAPINGAIVIGDKQTGVGALDIGYSTVRAGPINIANPASACAINIGRPLTIAYTILPTSNTQIGYVINCTPPAAANFTVPVNTTPITENKPYSPPLLPKGTWMCVGTAGIFVGGTSGTITSCVLQLIYVSASGIIGKQQNNLSFTPPTNALTSVLNVSGIIESDGTSNFSFDIVLTYFGVGAVFSTQPSSNEWKLKFIRVG